LKNSEDNLKLEINQVKSQLGKNQNQVLQLKSVVDSASRELPLVRASLLASLNSPSRHPESIFEEAVNLCEAGDFKQAIVSLNLCLSGIDKNSKKFSREFKSDVNGQLGVALQYSGDMDGARRAYLRAVEEDSSAHACYANLALVCFSTGNASGGDEYLRRAEELSPENPAYASIRRLHFN